MCDVLTIADAILRIAKDQGKSLTPMQLVKLTYIAHGWSLAINNEPLFSNKIEAWQYGPVIPDLYHATKSYGRNPIPSDEIGGLHDIGIDERKLSLLRSVFRRYGNLDGITLSYMTHRADTPWSKVYVSNRRNIEINDRLIADHYKYLAEQLENGSIDE